MRYFWLSLLMLPLAACATVTAESEQKISIATTPEGATCTASNSRGTNTSEPTPSSVTVQRAFDPLAIRCELDGATADATLQPGTRGRAYGNILLLGFPALVDAYTEKGYEYADSVNLTLTVEGSHVTLEP